MALNSQVPPFIEQGHSVQVPGCTAGGLIPPEANPEIRWPTVLLAALWLLVSQ